MVARHHIWRTASPPLLPNRLLPQEPAKPGAAPLDLASLIQALAQVVPLLSAHTHTIHESHHRNQDIVQSIHRTLESVSVHMQSTVICQQQV